MKSLSYILIGISTLAACSGNHKTTFPRYSDFPETKAIKAQVADLDTILVWNSIAVVMDLHNADHFRIHGRTSVLGG